MNIHYNSFEILEVYFFIHLNIGNRHTCVHEKVIEEEGEIFQILNKNNTTYYFDLSFYRKKVSMGILLYSI